MQPAFLRIRVLPRPSAGAFGFAVFDGSGAGGAADALIAIIVEFIIGDATSFNVVFDLTQGPIS